MQSNVLMTNHDAYLHLDFSFALHPVPWVLHAHACAVAARVDWEGSGNPYCLLSGTSQEFLASALQHPKQCIQPLLRTKDYIILPQILFDPLIPTQMHAAPLQ